MDGGSGRRRTGHASVPVVALGVALSLMTGCAAEGRETASRPVGTATGATPPATTTGSDPATDPPPPVRPHDAAHPLRVLVTGDSFAQGLAPAVGGALADPAAASRFAPGAVVPRTPPERDRRATELAAFAPDVVVVFVTGWEERTVAAEGRDLRDPAQQAVYRAEVLDPWLDRLTAPGARVVWIGPPRLRAPDADERFRALAAAVRQAAEAHRAAAYLDPDPALAGAGDLSFHEVIDQPGGTVRVRQTDGIGHLCAEGAARLTDRLLAELARTDALPTVPGWRDGAWRAAPEYAARC